MLNKVNYIPNETIITALNLNQIQDEIINLTTQFLDKTYPIGAIYLSVSGVSPASFFGGTWEQIEGRFLLAASSSYPAGSIGGNENVVLSIANMPAHTHTRGTMNITGGFSPWSEGSGIDITQEQGAFYSVRSSQYGWGTTNGRDADNEYIYFDASRSWTGETSSVGSGTAHENMPPYLAVYIWKRIE